MRGMNTREQVLSLLKKAQGTWVSGDDLARTVAMTRSAVWKHVCRLREEGCAIRSSTRKGYLLTETPDRLVPWEIRDGLATGSFGKGEILWFDRTESTNTTAKAMALSGAPEGTLVLAESQTAGRGRKGRSWHSPTRDGLYASLVLRPRLLLAQAGRIPILASLAAADALTSLGLSSVRVKWPNDVLLGGKKVAGVLTELGAEMDSVDYMVVGLGMNVNMRRFPRRLQGSATSLLLETGGRFLRYTVLVQYLTRFQTYYGRYAEGIHGDILERWRDLAGVIGRGVFVEAEGSRPGGTVQDLDEDGALIVQSRDGVRVRVSSGDVRFQDPGSEGKS